MHKSQLGKCWKGLDQDFILLFTNDSRWLLALLPGFCLPSLCFMRISICFQLTTFLNLFPADRILGSPKTFFFFFSFCTVYPLSVQAGAVSRNIIILESSWVSCESCPLDKNPYPTLFETSHSLHWAFAHTEA